MLETDLLRKCIDAGIRLTAQRTLIIETLLNSDDHPDADLVYRRAVEQDQSISLPTVYRTLNLLDDAGIVKKINMNDGKARFESVREDHDHLIDADNGHIHEFYNQELKQMLNQIAEKMGYEVIDHRIEIIGKKRGESNCDCIQIKVY
ncbi:transcriptional repressor [Alphaproteobacteria bacterium]|jgi:Fur family ferric uptake transcriptional regulator|nr:transcriptional repressor [Alphaproteobacteria bacterium]MDC0461401.1 transcriptional repressor [Alphaproteobacteria bacterium]MDC3311628.1 transcriptional repressor [Alphaproteobacteria bacterium]